MGECAIVPDQEIVEVDGHELKVSNPAKVFFPECGVTKLDLVRYYLSVGPGALLGCRDRPSLLKRYPHGAAGDFFFQKRVPESRPDWLETATVHFPSGRSANFLVMHDVAHIIWSVNLGCIDINPWPVRKTDVDHPDELRIDLDPSPGVPFSKVRETALVVREVLERHNITAFPKTSGSRGIHINARIEPEWGFSEVRRAALAFARAVEAQAPKLATSKWWKEERHGVFLDYNQNARDRTVASAYSVRPVPDARVSCPITWDEVARVEPQELRIDTVPERFEKMGDPGALIDETVNRLDDLLELAERQEHEGLGDAPWPPHFAKQADEPRRVQPSKARTDP